ncbi:hypothetical protein LGL55_10630 [Clostridium tagluense]|nr:hypothetical protein [Clostridium tagluense]MCB2300657.1 hypothetical protein [Clostridium tagluense]MCB2311605.1 hypothetical protein [Clostridium tagluense]MCB2316329.1 hypothetical protein [Clostridium tagluense]MCB2321287.1 hypothetical protein [Clostridium tagluense]MCB2326198.1 hypothetical protein [Clostridium tagluense]
MYLNLHENGTSINDIDEMDLYYYIDLLSYKANKELKIKIIEMDNAGL